MKTAASIIVSLACWFGLADAYTHGQGVRFYALAKFTPIGPSNFLMPKLKIMPQSGSTDYMLYLTDVKPGQYILKYGKDKACFPNIQTETSKFLTRYSINDGKNEHVQLTVPSVEQLREQPVLLLEAPQDVAARPVGCGTFIVQEIPR